MKLSVIIVNYNVKYFLTQCLYSALEAQQAIEAVFGAESCEIIVADNASKDESASYIKKRFPDIQFIENKENKGFSGANNRCMERAKGEFILLLNPDTIVPEDAFVQIVRFMDEHPEAGGLGVRMIDGQGKFLPESKRAFPTPKVSFYKIFGLAKLFPKSRKFGQYHLSYLSENETHQVDVLSGAFMLLRKKTLQKTGLLDETFFMYGEDIDLSYRITKAGYKNYYYPHTQIIHYKGESTKKGSLNYVYMFYNAMDIFVQKHINKTGTRLYSRLIKGAIWLRALLSAGRRIAEKTFLPLADALLFFLGFVLITPLWENFKFGDSSSGYPLEFLKYIVPGNILLWILFIFISKGYRKNAPLRRLNRGILWGIIITLSIYSLLNENYRFSRALLLLGSFWAIFSANSFRHVLHLLKIKRFAPSYPTSNNSLILCPPDEQEKIKSILTQNKKKQSANNLFDFINQKITPEILQEIIKKNKFKDLIISHSAYSHKELISLFSFLSSEKDTKIKTFLPREEIIIGCEEQYLLEQEKLIFPPLAARRNLQKKRLNDLVVCFFLLLANPIALLLTDRRKYFFKNIVWVLRGKLTWVGYRPLKNPDLYAQLPAMQPGVLHPQMDNLPGEEECLRANFYDIKNYDFLNEIYVIFFHFRHLGNKVS